MLCRLPQVPVLQAVRKTCQVDRTLMSKNIRRTTSVGIRGYKVHSSSSSIESPTNETRTSKCHSLSMATEGAATVVGSLIDAPAYLRMAELTP